MYLRELSVPGAWEITPLQIDDHRGLSLELFSDPAFQRMAGRGLELSRIVVTVSGEGVLRGLHHDGPDGQGPVRYATCATGTAFAAVADVRIGSPAFGEWSGVVLDGTDHRALLVPPGVALGVLALEPGTTITTLVSGGETPGAAWSIDAADPHLAVEWPTSAVDGTVLHLTLDEVDGVAPSLLDAAAAGELPRYEV